jgi:heme exporter protein CcmD
VNADVAGVVHQADLWASYIWPAYVLTIGGMAALLVWAWVSMRTAEKRAEGMRKR